MPRPAPQPLVTLSQSNGSAPPISSADGSKRKAPDADGETNGSTEPIQQPQLPQNGETTTTTKGKGKRAKKNGTVPAPPAAPEKNGNSDATPPGDEAEIAHARAVAAYIPFLKAENLMQPKLPSREEMEKFILELRKKALVEEYFGDEAAS